MVFEDIGRLSGQVPNFARINVPVSAVEAQRRMSIPEQLSEHGAALDATATLLTRVLELVRGDMPEQAMAQQQQASPGPSLRNIVDGVSLQGRRLASAADELARLFGVGTV